MILLYSQIKWAKNSERAQWGQLISLPGYTAPNLESLKAEGDLIAGTFWKRFHSHVWNGCRLLTGSSDGLSVR